MACANNWIRVARDSEDCLRNEEYSSSEIGAKRFIEPLCKADITGAALLLQDVAIIIRAERMKRYCLILRRCFRKL